MASNTLITMYILDFPRLIKQILPITWRKNWREKLLTILLKPLEKIYHKYRLNERNTAQIIGRSGQSLALEQLLSQEMQNRIYIEPHQSTPFHFIIKIPPELDENKKQRIKALAMKYKIATTNFSISELP